MVCLSHTQLVFVLAVLLSANTLAFSPVTHVQRRVPSVVASADDISLPAAQAASPRHQRSTLLFMGWGPDPVWEKSQITAVESACASGASVTMTVTVPVETAAGFEQAGQYVQVKTSGVEKPAFLAIASAPDAENARFEFLIKKKENIEWLTNMKVGDSLDVSQVMGGGYPTEENLEGFKYDFPTQNVLLFAAGSGIAPIASAIESGSLNAGGSRTCRLYYGERTSDDLCFVDRFTAWAAAGVEVVPVLSRPEPTWNGREGYVQTVLEEDGVTIPRNSGALLCGMKGMTDSVKDLLVKAGVFEGRVLFNF